MIFLLSFLLVASIFGGDVVVVDSASSPQCLDDNGQPVDWFIVYKFPYLKSLNKPELFGGYHYSYITSKTIENGQDGWQFSPNQITEDKSIFGRTLSGFFSSNRSKLTAMFYNDQPPTGKDVPSTYAHAKGLMVSDSKQGFWLIHTVPKFTDVENKYNYVSSGGRYGQVAMCLSLPVTELTKVIRENLLISRPYVYHLHIDSETEKTDLGKALTDLEHHKWIQDKQFVDLNLKTLQGEEFRSFYKSPKYEVDLYADILAKQLKTSIRAETWRHPPGDPLDSECKIKQEEVENIKEIQLRFENSDLDGKFSYYDDHSKWALSRDQTLDLVCIGDINRVHSQFHRGGGTTCIANAQVWNSFNSFISKVEKCPDDKFNGINDDEDDSDDDDDYDAGKNPTKSSSIQTKLSELMENFKNLWKKVFGKKKNNLE